jgi:uncharacterized protein (TIRG00374 family)
MERSTAAASDEPASDHGQQPALPAKAPNQFLRQSIGIALAIFFLWLTFRNTDFKQLWAHMVELNGWWLIVIGLVCLLGHYIRAVRWCILLKPLAPGGVSQFNSFCAVLIGYAVNVAVPRGGEIARIVSISKSESLPWVGVLPTLFIDRLLDLAFLVLLLGVTLLLLPQDLLKANGWLVPAGAVICAATVAGLAALPSCGRLLRYVCRQDLAVKHLPSKLIDKLSGLSEQFDLGTRSLSDKGKLPTIAVLSLSIWVTYFANMYFMVYAFDLQDSIDLAHALVIFTIGTVGVLVPTPGAVGSYHLLVSKALNMVSDIEPSMALAFTTIFHAYTFIIITCAGAAVCFALQSSGVGRRSTDKDR